MIGDKNDNACFTIEEINRSRGFDVICDNENKDESYMSIFEGFDVDNICSCGNIIEGNSSICTPCYQKEYRKNNPERIKRLRIKHQHGITLEEYNAAMATQHCCEICGDEDNLVYDHDHNDDKFRGVICRTCNKGLGLLGDDIKGLNRAILYLRNVKIRKAAAGGK